MLAVLNGIARYNKKRKLESGDEDFAVTSYKPKRMQ
jgi:hypothetical protein